jgi:hypothetical protein
MRIINKLKAKQEFINSVIVRNISKISLRIV